jgi:phage gp29-like protein
MQRVVSLLEAGERGEYADLQWLYYYMERSDPVIYSVMQRRRAALLDCDWDVRVVAPVGEGSGGEARAEAQGRIGNGEAGKCRVAAARCLLVPGAC